MFRIAIASPPESRWRRPRVILLAGGYGSELPRLGSSKLSNLAKKKDSASAS